MPRINEHEFELNNEKYLLTWHENDIPRLTKQGIKQSVLPVLSEYITIKNLPIQLINSNGNKEVPYTLANKVLKLFSNNTFKIKKTYPTEESKKKEVADTNKIAKKSKKNKPSINKIEEFSKIIEKYNLDKLKDDNRPKLLIIPCSKSKSPGGINTFSSIFNLNPNRTNSIIQYNNERIINPNYFINENRIGVNIVDVNYFNAAFNNILCKKAIDRYDSGGSIFYSTYNLKNLYLQKINNNKLHVLIISGLYGLLKYDDYIPDYHFEMKRNTIWTNQNDFSIRNEVNNYIVNNNIPEENVFYSLSKTGKYREALKPNHLWKSLWINNYGNGANKNSAEFIAQEFLTRL
jgi:cytoplasmic iron level regulating protein YaaA (DUF328/UPF0246 family)